MGTQDGELGIQNGFTPLYFSFILIDQWWSGLCKVIGAKDDRT